MKSIVGSRLHPTPRQLRAGLGRARPRRQSLARLAIPLAFAISGFCMSPPPGHPQDLFIAGGTIVDPDRREQRQAGLLIVDGTIRGFLQEAPKDFGGSILDARGKWVIPGLHDLHVHSLVNLAPRREREIVGTPAAARRMIYAGVTGFVDLFNDERYVLGLRDRWRAELDSARAELFAAGPCLTATGGHCTQYPATTRTIDTPEQARREVAELAKRRPDVIKIVYDARPLPTIDEPTLRAAIAAAARAGIPAVVHVGNWQEARDAVLAGAPAITHVDPDEVIPGELVALLAERQVRVIPTVVLYLGLLDLAGGRDRLDSPLLRDLAAPQILAAYRAYDTRSSRAFAFMSEARGRILESVRRLAAAGVPLLTGTDSGNWGTVLGYSLHHEMALLVEAGLDPWHALRASTSDAGRFLGRSWGMAPDAEGSLVLLDASPIEDIRNTEKIAAVVHRGFVVDRRRLSQQLFSPLWSSEVAALVFAHLRPRHLAWLAASSFLLVGGFVGARRVVRRFRPRRSHRR